MKIVITGGTGFLGRHIKKKLDNGSNEIIILSRREDIDTVKTDYSYESLKEILKGKDAIIHLAATRSGEFEFSKFYKDIQITEDLYKAANENNIKNIVFASSISVYSNIENLPWNEKQDVEPVSMYGIAKLTNEMIGNIYNKKYNMKIKNLRMAHLFGPNERNNYMINYFFRLAYNGENINIDTDSTAKREFLYVEDAAKAFFNAVNLSDVSGTFNIGSQINLTNLEVAKEINRVFKSSGKVITINPDKPDNSKPSYMDSELSRKVLGFNCDYNFEKALKEVLFYLEEQGNVPLRY